MLLSTFSCNNFSLNFIIQVKLVHMLTALQLEDPLHCRLTLCVFVMFRDWQEIKAVQSMLQL